MGLYWIKDRVYARCVDCTSYWDAKTKPKFDNTIDVSDQDKSVMRPATLGQIENAGCREAVNATWSHSGGFRPV